MNRHPSLPRRALACLLAANLCSVGMPGIATAATFGTDAFLDQTGADSGAERAALQARINDRLAGQAVADQLQALGVDPALIEGRLAALSTEELRAMDGRLQGMPAGSGVVGVLGVVFVVLIVLEVLGVTDVFSRV